MKIRTSFVSNSSSSSFIIQKKDLTANQYNSLLRADYPGWDITDEGYYIRGYTFMDNYGIDFEILGIADNNIEWDCGY